MLMTRARDDLETAVALGMLTARTGVADDQHRTALAAASGVGRHGGDVVVCDESL